MSAVIFWCTLDGCCYFLVDSECMYVLCNMSGTKVTNLQLFNYTQFLRRLS